MCCVVCLFVVCLFVCLTGVCRCVFVTQTLICAYETGTMHVLVCTFVSCGCVVYMCMFLWETPLKRTLPRVLGKGGVIPILGDLGRYVGWGENWDGAKTSGKHPGSDFDLTTEFYPPGNFQELKWCFLLMSQLQKVPAISKFSVISDDFTNISFRFHINEVPERQYQFRCGI